MAESPLYLDNAATSWPKPPQVGEAMAAFLNTSAGNPGRGGHRLARAAAAPVETVRERLAALINAPCPSRVVMTGGCTDSVNLAIHGVIRGQLRRCCERTPRVVTTVAEHNAVLRTLNCYATDKLIDLEFIGIDSVGRVDPDEVLAKCDGRTVLVAVTHASNAIGTIQPITEIGAGLREKAPGALFMVDAAQTAGHMPIDVQSMNIDLLAIAGHKGLLGPTGTGCLYVGQRAFPDDPNAPRLFCERRGGTGAVAPGLEMPNTLPDALEAGTVNAVGFAGLLAGMDNAPADRHEHETRLTKMLLDGLGSMPGVTIYGPPTTEGRTAVVSFNIEGHTPRDLGAKLCEDHAICARGGTHCAPMMHEAIGSGVDGALRVSPGYATTEDEIARFLEVIASFTPAAV